MDTYERYFGETLRFLTDLYYISLSDRLMNQAIGFEMIRMFQMKNLIGMLENLSGEYESYG